MSWQIIAIIAPIFFVGYQAISKFLPKDIPVFLVTAYASLAGTIVMFVLYFFTSETKSFALSSKQFPLVIGIGTLIILGNAAVIKAYGLGAPQSTFSSIFYPMLIFYSLIFGLLFWGEKLDWHQVIGIVLLLAGIILITKFRV